MDVRPELAATDAKLLLLGSSTQRERAAPQSPGVGQRLRARFWRLRLDQELAEGGSPWRSDVLALRARQLAEERVRSEVAAWLRQVADDAAQPHSVLVAVAQRRSKVLVELCQAEVLEWREGLLGLADRLQGAAPVNPCGVARARVLLNDGSGPLYNPDASRSLGEMIWWIADGFKLSRSARAAVLTDF